MARRKIPADYHALAEERGFCWLGPEVTNNRAKTCWKCEQGHHWKACYHDIQQGSGCPVCAIERQAERRRKKPADYHALAEERGFRWLGPEVPNNHTKTRWECEQGHQWEAHYNNVQQGSGCPLCDVEKQAEKRRKKPADYHALAEERGFRWLGPEVTNTQTKTRWKCGQGHFWEATYSSIQQGHGCLVCAIEVQAERKRKKPADYRALTEERDFRWLGPEVPNNHTKTRWECEQGHRWEAPYHSIQQGHGCPFCAGLAPKIPADYHILAQESGFRWLGPEVPNTQTKTRWECGQGHRWEARYSHIQQGSGCPFCAGIAPKIPAHYHVLAEERGLCWIGPEALNIHTKTSWECEQGHHWQASYHSIQQGRGCPVCAVERQAAQRRNTPADYYALAEERGLRWLGPVVPNNRTTTGWECEQGHRWETTYSSIQYGHGCPFCAGLAPKTPTDYHTLAEERSFRWLGPEVPNTHTKTGWECEQGHRWEAPFNSVRQGSGCPTCVDMVHGRQVSQVQRDLCDMLGGELNLPCLGYSIDVALNVDGRKIAVEYDSWYWHGHRQDLDAKRVEDLLVADWRVLQIKSNALLPTREQLDNVISRLLAGEKWVEIVLDDWGEGPTRFESD